MRANISHPSAEEMSQTLQGLDREILIAREGDHYRLLHGHLRLVTAIYRGGEVAVDVKNEGTVRIVKTCGGLHVERGSQRLPLLRDE